MKKYQMYIDAKFVDAANGKWFDSYNPFTGKVWSQVAEGAAADVDRAVQAAHRAFTGDWKRINTRRRGQLLNRFIGRAE